MAPGHTGGHGLAAAARAPSDPFLTPRDPAEERVGEVMREALLEQEEPERTFRQDGGGSGYALIVPSLSGEAVLTVPGLREADFMYHGNPGSTAPDLAAFIASAISASGADHLRIPMLTEQQGRALSDCLAELLPDWRLDWALTAVSPVVKPGDGERKQRKSFRRAVGSARKDGVRLKVAASFPQEDIRALHTMRWGNNRSDGFFRMLASLVEEGCAEVATARTADGDLVAVQVDVLGTYRRHAYYAVSDLGRAPGSGTAVQGFLWRRFVGASKQRYYSYGRGSERYKYHQATHVLEHYEVRGFFAPRPSL